MDKKIEAMTHHCFKLLICLAVVVNTQVHGTGTGEVQEIGGMKCYVSGPKNSNTSVILASDVLGYEVPHLRLLADKAGGAGFYTLVPDFFHGDPFVSNKPFDDWIKKHPAEKGIEDANRVINALKSQGINKFGAAGFCWGAKVTVDLTKPPSIQKPPPIRAAVLLHPTFINVTDIEGVKVPISILGGEKDKLTPPSLIKQYESALNARHNKVNSSVTIFPGAEHGWTTIYNDTDRVAVKRAKKAHKDMLKWFIKYLK